MGVSSVAPSRLVGKDTQSYEILTNATLIHVGLLPVIDGMSTDGLSREGRLERVFLCVLYGCSLPTVLGSL
jgi:hypothetical protein